VWPGKIHLLENSEVLRKVAERTLSWIDERRHTPFTLAEPAAAAVMPEMRGTLRA
jgi:hypothetical protein